MKNCILLLALTFLVLFVSVPVNANLISNGDFETGTLAGWSTSGDVSIAYSGLLANVQGMDHYYARLGLGITDGISQLRQDIDVTGYTSLDISFSWAFDYWDNSSSAEDTFISLVRQDGTPALRIKFVDLTTQGTSFWDPDADIAFGTFSDTVDISNYVTDDARIIFRLVEGSDSSCWTGTASVAGIDNVVVTGNGALTPVPEPATVLLMGAGLLGMVVVSRKRFAKKS